MIVLMNVKITDRRLGAPGAHGVYQRASWAPKYSRGDVLKYTLASYAALEPVVSKYHLHIVLEDQYHEQQAEFEEFIRGIIPADKLELHWTRQETVTEWQAFCDRTLPDDNEVVWFAGNDDHVFIDYDLDVVRAAEQTLKADADPNAIVYYSHWPEQMQMSKHLGGKLTEDGNFFKFTWNCFDSISMLKAGRFKSYWTDPLAENAVYKFRTDYLHATGMNRTGNCYSPVRELVRHYDGYSHVGFFNNVVPHLVIPPGFFEDNVKLRFGYRDRQADAVNINALTPELHLGNPNSPIDTRWVEADVPLFWKSRISSIDYAPDYDVEHQTRMRDDEYLAASHLGMACFNVFFEYGQGHDLAHFKYIRSKDLE
jgi:hypothetical protein